MSTRTLSIEVTEEEVVACMQVTNAEDLGMGYTAQNARRRRDVVVKILRAYDAANGRSRSLESQLVG